MQAPLLSWSLAALALATLLGVAQVAGPPPLVLPGAVIQGAPLDAAPTGGVPLPGDPSGSNPSGSNPSGSNPSGSNPSGSNPSGGGSILGPDGSLALERLAFDDYDPPELRAEPVTPFELEAFPAEIAALHGSEVVLHGYPLVTQFAGERTDRLLLTRFPPGCCFGSVPVIDEWVAVTLAEGSPPSVGYEPIALRGRLEVGEVLDEQGFVESLYRLAAARILEE